MKENCRVKEANIKPLPYNNVSFDATLHLIFLEIL
jgi:hypothetical protein